MRHLFSPKAFGTQVPNAFYLTLIVLTLGSACQRQPQPVRLQGEAQGTYYNIVYYDSLQRDLQPQIDSLLDDFDLTASLWVEQSLLRQVNANSTETVTSRFADLWMKSDSIRRYSQGAFDCRVGRIVQAWGFSFKQKEELSESILDSLIRNAQADVCIDTSEQGLLMLHKSCAETELDFNAIAQGYSVDLLAQMLDQHGISRYLIDVGGEVIARGTKPNGEPWMVGIERPAETQYSAQEIETVIRLTNQSVVTSGNYRKYYEKDGVRYSHTIDPATGRPVSHTLLSASVVSSSAWYADAMATAFMVMGLERSKAFIAAHPDNADIQAVLFIYDDHGEYKTFATPQFEKLIQ